MSPYREINLDDRDHTFTEKIDVIELILNVIKEQEEKLEELVSHLEIISPRLISLGKNVGDTQSINSALLDMKAYLEDSNSYKLEPP